MARLWQSGFENNTTGTTEWQFSTGAGLSIGTATVRSGTYALAITGTAQNYVQTTPVSGTGPWFFRAYFRFSSLPSGLTTIMSLLASGANEMGIKITSAGKLQLWKLSGTAAQIGSDSSALSTNTWYRIEMKFDGTGGAGAEVGEGVLDGTTFATSSSQTFGSTTINTWRIGENILSEGISCSAFIDDLAFNDSTGGSQNSYPGSGKIIHLKPSGAGDSTQWTPKASTNFSQVNEVTPDDATSYVSDSSLNNEDLYNVDDSGIGASDTVNVVAVGGRFANDTADATTAFKFEIEKTTGGTISQSAAIVPNSTTYVTNTITSNKYYYPLVTYQDPDSSNWTQTTLDSMQIGVKATTIGIHVIRLSTIWASVDYTPAAAPSNIVISGTKTLLGAGQF